MHSYMILTANQKYGTMYINMSAFTLIYDTEGEEKMKYTIRFGACGHEATISMIGKGSDRERKIAYLEECGLCPECYKAMMKDKEREAEKEKYADIDSALEFYGFAELEGTEKQIKYATNLRREKIGHQLAGMRSGEVFVENPEDESTVRDWIEWMANITQSKWWIENDSLEVGEMYEQYKKSAKVEASMQTIYPENVDCNNVCTITEENNQIALESDKDAEIVGLCHELNYKWTGGRWKLNVTSRKGNVSDRIVELAHKLLLNGFPVKLDKALAKRAVNGDYEPINPRWIVAGKNGKVLLYFERGGSIYDNARKLSSAVWDKEMGAVSVSAKYYEEIRDFADMHCFNITSDAMALLDDEQSRFECSSRTTIAGTLNHIQQKDGLVDLLNSRDVIEDLQDED